MIKLTDSDTKNYTAVYFISDLHLGIGPKDEDYRREDMLCKFLYTLKDGSCLVIVGDLFDYWFEFRQVYQKGFFRTHTALYDLNKRGIRVHYLIGNHDFFHRDFFESELGINLIEDSLTMKTGSKRIFAAHGDGYVKKDYGYKVLKAVLRNKTIQFFYGLLHPDFGLWLARTTSKGSRHYTDRKDYGKVDGLVTIANEKIDEGYDFVIFGHSHNRKFEKYKNGHYINLGSWFQQPCYGVLINDDFEILDLT